MNLIYDPIIARLRQKDPITGTDLSGVTTADIADSTNKRYLSDAQKTIATQAATTSLSGYLTNTDWNTFNGKQAALGYTPVPDSRTVNGHALTGNVSVSASDVGLGNVTNESKATMFTSPVFTGNASGLVYNSGAVTTPSFTDNGDGSCTIGTAEYVFYSDTVYSLPLKRYTIAGASYSLTDNATNYIVVNYNGGSPIMQVLTNNSTVNQSAILPIYTVYRHGTELNMVSFGNMASGLVNKLCRRFVKTQRFAVEPGGLTLGEVATRDVTITGGTLWVGAQENTIESFTSVSDTLLHYYHVAGVWTRSIVTAYNNTQYDNGTDLATLTNNRYAVNWIFRDVSTTRKEAFIVSGSGDYSLAQAQQSTVPASLPQELTTNTILVGRIIVQKSIDTATQIDSAFTTTLGMTATTDHNGLSNLQGGTSGEYYHLTSAEYTQVKEFTGSFTSSNSTGFAWTDNTLAITHNLGKQYVDVIMYDNNGVKVDYTLTGTSTSVVSVSFPIGSIPITGTWNVRIR